MDTGLIPAETRKSTRTDLSLVCPDLKSSPPMNVFIRSASSMAPGTNVFWGEPFKYVHCVRKIIKINLIFFKYRQGAVDTHSFQGRSDSENRAGTDLRMVSFDGGEQIIRGVVDSRNYIAKSFRIGCPQYDDFIQFFGFFKFSYVLPDCVQLFWLGARY